MKDFVIIGASGFGREVYETTLLINENKPTYNVLGFADDDQKLWGEKINGLICIGGMEALKQLAENQEIYSVIAIANAKAKKIIAAKLDGFVQWDNVIHPEAHVSRFAEIGYGNIFQCQVVISPNATIGNHCMLNGHSGLGHDASMDDFSSVMSHCDIMGGVHVGKAVYMGAGSRIIQYLEVGHDAFICAGAVVFKNVGAGDKVLGNPAKVIGSLF